jgi:uracil-DNA glycosylase
MDVKIEPGWKAQLSTEFEEDYFIALTDFVRKEYGSNTIYPPAPDIFKAFDRCPFDNVKVVILGQDPYHEPGQAHGLSFSVNEGVVFPPSLVNILKEVKSDTDAPFPVSGDLTRWAVQGVLLLNATLTVRARQAGSHQNHGWERFTDAVIRRLTESRDNIVYMLWGAYAGRKSEFIDGKRNLILKAVHPSPLSAYRGFFGCKHFSRANEYLTACGKTPVEW